MMLQALVLNFNKNSIIKKNMRIKYNNNVKICFNMCLLKSSHSQVIFLIEQQNVLYILCSLICRCSKNNQ